MVVSTQSPELEARRKERLELLAKTHYGDCKAPCNLTCPGGINVQGYVNLIARGAPPQEIANFRLSPEAQARARELLARNQAGTLSATEKAELDLYTQLEHLLGLVKVRAQQLLADSE